MPELLLELGCEELPAGFVRRAYTDLESAIKKGLEEAGLTFGDCRSMGTPRRLIVSIQDIPKVQPDRLKESRGPSVQAAYGPNGELMPPLLGFCKGQGIDPAELVQESGYVWAKRQIKGKPAAELLAEILPNAIKGLVFDKGMRWGAYRMRFARPIRWILAAYAGELVPFQLEAVKSGLLSRGHRFNHPGPFECSSFESLQDELLRREVEPDVNERIVRIREGVTIACSAEPELDGSLVEENAFLTEWPSAVEGEFKPEFLGLPEPVLVTVMAKHERFFPVRERGKLTNKFLSIRNGGDAATVRDGNAWVLNARFNDAQFFFDEDCKSTLETFLERTSGILFQEKLGTVRERANRLAVLAVAASRATKADELETALARDAATLSKADLSTGLVSELPELQGRIGAEYARREGKPEAVCYALAKQYEYGKIVEPKTPDERTAIRLMLADQIDKLAGYLGVGLAPSGSSDPYGLRRAATVVIECCSSWPEPGLRPLPLFRTALDLYDASNIPIDREAATHALAELFKSRYESLLAAIRHDVREGAMLPDRLDLLLDPRSVAMRARCLTSAANDVAFVQTATRPLNIVDAARQKGVGFAHSDPLLSLDETRLESAEALQLLSQVKAIEDGLHRARMNEDDKGIVESLKTLELPINRFFDTTMVMVEDPDIRFARLSLLNAVSEMLTVAGDFSKLVVEG